MVNYYKWRIYSPSTYANNYLGKTLKIDWKSKNLSKFSGIPPGTISLTGDWGTNGGMRELLIHRIMLYMICQLE